MMKRYVVPKFKTEETRVKTPHFEVAKTHTTDFNAIGVQSSIIDELTCQIGELKQQLEELQNDSTRESN